MSLRRTFLTVAAALIAACSDEKAEKAPAVELLGQVATEVRDKPRIQLLVKLAGETMNEEETTMQRVLEEAIERDGVGRITSSGTQPGYLFIVVEADNNSADAIERLRAVALDAGVLKRSSFRVIGTGS
jgi:hypothetical protein